MKEFVSSFGYKSNRQLIDTAYGTEEMRETLFGKKLLESNIPDQIKIENFEGEELEDLVLGLNTNFVQLLKHRICNTSINSSSNWRKILENV